MTALAPDRIAPYDRILPATRALSVFVVPFLVLASTLMGIATLLHWDTFSHSHVAFWMWVALHFTTPFFVAGVWLRNRHLDDGAPDADDAVVPIAVGRLIGGIGPLAAGTSAFLFPTAAIDRRPCPLTPLTARVTGATFALGIAAIGAFTECRWSPVRRPSRPDLNDSRQCTRLGRCHRPRTSSASCGTPVCA